MPWHREQPFTALCKPQFELRVWASMALYKISDGWQKLFRTSASATPDLKGNVLGDIVAQRSARLNAATVIWVFVLTSHQVRYYGFEIRPFSICFAPGAALATEVVQNQINRLILPFAAQLTASN